MSSSTPQFSPFLERLIRFLIPFFIGVCPDLDSARTEILETLGSYGARTRSEMLNAAQIIAFGLSALDALYEIRTTEMSPSMRLRIRGCANNLNRSCQQNEQSLTARLAREMPAATDPAAEPVDDVPEPVIEEAIQEARAKIANYRDRLSAARLVTSPRAMPASQQDRNRRLWGDAMVGVLADMGMPVQPVSAV